MTPNRYGAKDYRIAGQLCCRHGVPLWQECARCNELLRQIGDSQKPELPTLCGTGDVVEFDPVAILESLGDAMEDPPPKGGGSIKA